MGFKELLVKSIALILLCGLILSSCLKKEEAKSSSGGAAEVTATTPVKWSASAFNGGGLDFKVGNDLANTFAGGDYDENDHHPVEQMMKKWNESSNALDFFRLDITTVSNKDLDSVSSYLNDGELGVYRSDNWISGVSSQALAITAYKAFHRNSGTSDHHLEIVHADIIINYRDYNFTTDSNDNFFYDLHSVLLHEMGHALGLKHVENNSINSVMAPYLGRSDVSRELTNHDKTTVQSLYGLSSLKASPFMVAALSTPSKFELPKDARESEDGAIIGVIELRADGECRHYLEGKLTQSHHHDIKKGH